MIVLEPMQFSDAFGACNFIVTWNGESVNDLFDAIRFARQEGDRFIQEKLIEYILNIPTRNPRPMDIPAFVGRPVWAVDKNERALIGMPGDEDIVQLSSLRNALLGVKQNGATATLPSNGESQTEALTKEASDTAGEPAEDHPPTLKARPRASRSMKSPRRNRKS